MAGPDGMKGELLKGAFIECRCETGGVLRSYELLSDLHVLFSSVFRSGAVPSVWCSALLSAVYKKGDASSMDDYRGIAVGAVMGKLFNIILDSRLSRYAEQHGFRAKGQAGFRQDKRTSDHVFVLKHLIDKHRLGRASQAHMFVCFVDFRKAYDSVRRDLLMKCLVELGLHGNMLSTIMHMYWHAPMVTKVGHQLGQPFDTTRGVKQGDPLSPLLFGLFIDRLEGWLEQHAPGSGVQVKLHQNQSPGAENPFTTPAAAEIVSAAATIQDLRSLTVKIDFFSSTLLAADELLLPLIAAAGGPGRSLQQLTLDGRCVTDVVPPEGPGRTQFQVNPEDRRWQLLTSHSNRTCNLMYWEDKNAQALDDPERELRSCDRRVSHTVLLTAAAVCPGVGWHHALQYLSCLRELNIKHIGDKLLDLPVQHLPASLKVLKGHKLHIFEISVGGAPAAGMAAAVHAAVCSLQTMVMDGSGDGSNAGSAPAGLRLHVLCLSECSLSSPGVLASSQLQHLTVIDSIWSGGWTAAATAWPKTRQLVWKYNAGVLGGSSSNPDSFANLFNVEVVQCVTGGFRQLRKFTVQQPPSLPAAAVLQRFPFAVRVRGQYPEPFEDHVL